MDGLAAVNGLPQADAAAGFSRCCGSSRWVDAMLLGRPFASTAALHEAARTAWRALDREDWLEAFAQHPRIGDLEAMRKRFAATWSQGEQHAAAGADEKTLAALMAGNLEYERRFGHIFIVCATGRSAADMLEDLRERLRASPAAELRKAASEQEKITALRLDKWLAEVP